MPRFKHPSFLKTMPWLVAACLATLPSLTLAQTPDAPVQVMIVGVSHMDNPGHDLHNMKHDDVLQPERQAEIVALTQDLARFKPTQVAIEQDKAPANDKYAAYLADTLLPSRDERVQLGFRLAKLAGLTTIQGIDADGDFPYPPVKAYAESHGFGPLLAQQNADIDRQIAAESKLLAEKGIVAELRYLNDPARLKNDNAFYRTMLRIGADATQPGADLLTGWYRRNFLICAKLLQVARPGDRIVVFYGAGHAFLLRQCVEETPGFRLVEPNDYLRQRS
ncbi:MULTISPECIES: DUF5694 domain-containing protein [unclassified Luteibacter]|uniref:DUF5694 domain-containing protein n=1 Tax=Luteibacter sp. PvP019 TaxID=3156436 RepID=UPI003390F5BE